MRVDKRPHSYYCEVDPHARSLFVSSWCDSDQTAERRGVLGVTVIGGSRSPHDTGRAVELFGTASVVILVCHFQDLSAIARRLLSPTLDLSTTDVNSLAMSLFAAPTTSDTNHLLGLASRE